MPNLVVIVVVSAAVLGACREPGEYNLGDLGVKSDADASYPPPKDSGVRDMVTETAAPDVALPDMTDMKSPDVSTGGNLGAPCSGTTPCRVDLRCAGGVCRTACTPAGTCFASSECPADQGCIAFAGDTYACVDAVEPGESCSGSEDACPNHHLCVQGADSLCLPTCQNIGSSCPSGGTCVSAAAGCSYCEPP